jgi:uncharacterized membrane protein
MVGRKMESIPKELYIFLVSASPIVELRGAIPLAFFYKFSIFKAFLISFLGNILPVPFLLIFLSPVSNRLRKLKIFDKFFTWFFERTKKKAKLVERLETIGLILFVAIPLPGTGAWTGSAAASIFRIRFKTAFLAIILGVFLAGILVTLISIGGIQIFRKLI